MCHYGPTINQCQGHDDMKLFTIDFETYYDSQYSLSRMTTEEYVMDDRFEIIMVGVKIDDQPPYVFSSRTLQGYQDHLLDIGLEQGAMLCQNTMFDALIIQHHLGIVPAMLLDTMCMAQALLKPTMRSISLDSLTKKLPVGIRKGTAVHDMKGRNLDSLSPHEYKTYAEYCKTDCEAEYRVFKHLMKMGFPREELKIIDMTLRMYIEPVLKLSAPILEGVITEARQHKAELMAKLPPEVTRANMMSNPQFADLLRKLGIEPPMKVSPTTGKPTYAFAKNDPEWKELQEEFADDEIVSSIIAARMGVKSTIAETRASRLLSIANQTGLLRVPLRYYGAHTGRYGGMEKINCQNFTRINPAKGPNQLRYAVRAPKGHVVYAVDLSQIEVRVTAWLAKAEALVKVFREKRDPYCEFGTRLYNRTITKADPKERFIAKTCILGLGYGMGHAKLRAQFRGFGTKATKEECQFYVNTYRDTYPQIPALWRLCDEHVMTIANGGQRKLGPCMVTEGGILLPNNMTISYPNMRYVESKKYTGWSYDFAGMGRTMWGGKMVENVVQALSRIIIAESMIKIDELGYRTLLQAHDELVYCIPVNEVDEADKIIMEVMTTPPSFAPDLPIDAESAWGDSYGECK